MKYFYDCEFIESGPKQPIQLISIGVVCEDGRELYLQNLDCRLYEASEWVQKNVLPNLQAIIESPSLPFRFHPEPNSPVWQHRQAIAKQLRTFVRGSNIELWGYYSDYDHVVLCQTFGSMIDLPEDWPKYTLDLKQLCFMLGNPTLPDMDPDRIGLEHNALADARWNKRAYEFLVHYGAAAAQQRNLTRRSYDQHS